MKQRASVLLLDDGELDDVRALLEELGADYVHLRGGAIPEQIEPPRDLFVATSRRAMLARSWGGVSEGPMKIGVVSEDSNTLRNMLRRIGFEYLVRRPVHPDALRLLLVRALYRGEERRREERVAVGCEVAFRIGFRRRSAILADMSSKGCRLLVDRPLAVGTRITLQLPKELTGGKALSQRAIVKRIVEPQKNLREHSLGLAFDGLTPAAREVVSRVMRERQTGPAVVSEQIARAAKANRGKPRASVPAAAPASDIDRRKHERAQFEREVVLLDDEANRVLVGRDISMGGMLVDDLPGLEPGQQMQIAIYGAPREEPFIVKARVLRRTDEGLALTFESVPREVAARLESMVGKLPSVESLEGGETDAVGTVVSRILEREQEIG